MGTKFMCQLAAISARFVKVKYGNEAFYKEKQNEAAKSSADLDVVRCVLGIWRRDAGCPYGELAARAQDP